MLARPVSGSTFRRSPVPGGHPVSEEPRVAVVLNANARKVTPQVIRSLSHVVPESDLFVSRSEMDARRIAQTCLERGYHTVFCGGGDGTFMGFVDVMIKQAAARGIANALPRFGVLKLGTGNAIASLVNASPLRGDGILDDVLRARANEVPSSRQLDLLSVDGKRTHFAGLGVDAKLLNDYVWMKEHLGKGLLKKWMSGPTGYFASVAFKTVPHYLTRSTFAMCEVVNGSKSKAYRLNGKGETVEEIAPGGLLYSGRLMMAAAATMPFYGFGFQMFPFAGERRGMMQLRLGALGAPEILVNLPKLWKGRWFPQDRIMDFHAKDVRIRFARPMPFQVGGDASGYRDQVHFAMAPESVELADFTGSIH